MLEGFLDILSKSDSWKTEGNFPLAVCIITLSSFSLFPCLYVYFFLRLIIYFLILKVNRYGGFFFGGLEKWRIWLRILVESDL